MPEVTGDATSYIYLKAEDLIDMLRMMNGETKVYDFGTVFRKLDGTFEIESEHEATLEFEMSDYAPDRDEC